MSGYHSSKRYPELAEPLRQFRAVCKRLGLYSRVLVCPAIGRTRQRAAAIERLEAIERRVAELGSLAAVARERGTTTQAVSAALVRLRQLRENRHDPKNFS